MIFMQKEKELFNITWDLLDEVDEYKYQVESLHYDNSFREFKFSRGQKNYDRIIKRLKSINLPEPKLIIFESIDIEEFKHYVVTILKKILGDKVEDDIKIAKTFINPQSYSMPTDVVTKYKDIVGISTPYEFTVSDKLNYIQLAQVINSEFTVLLRPLYQNFIHTIANIHYQRFPGIIATYVAIYELSNLLKQEKLITSYEDYYIYNDNGYAKDKGKEIIDVLPEYRHKDLLEHNEHNKFSFLVSDIYSTSLIEKYLEDENDFLARYKMMIEGTISIPDYLDYYGLSLKDKNVTLKYLNKVDEVEKRCK